MRLIDLALLLPLHALLFTLTRAGEFPVVDGIVGGVPDVTTLKSQDTTTQAWENPLAVPGQVRLVENSQICGKPSSSANLEQAKLILLIETTPGVYEAAGYADLSKSDSIWFWFFAARNNPETAPLILWFNGGPGSSSMYGLFQAHGPCRISNDSRTVRLNPFSWNTNANVLYIDQPAGVGFSVSLPLKIKTSPQAAVDIWSFFQIWLSDSRFSKFKGREVGIWAESYGGHYGPAFAKYFLAQNKAIAAKEITGIPVNLMSLGIGNGLTDPLVQYESFVNYAANNPYHPLVNSSVIQAGNTSWISKGGCRDQILDCYNSDSDSVCSRAQSYCNNNVLSRLNGKYDVYYVPTATPNPYPPDFSNFLNQNRLTIETQKIWVGANSEVYANFASSGDWMRNSRGDLEGVIDSGVSVLVYAGDADYIINYFGVEVMVDALNTKFSAAYKEQKFLNYTVKGTVTGVYKTVGTFSYLRVYGAGHMVPAYTYGGLEIGQAALQMFEQVVARKGLFST